MRGVGIFVGVELMKYRKTREPDRQTTSHVPFVKHALPLDRLFGDRH